LENDAAIENVMPIDLEVCHLARHGSSAQPLSSVPLSIKYDWQSTEWYIHNDRLIGRGARNQKPDGNKDTRYKIYTGLGRQHDIKILCPVLCYFVLIGYEI
jgi:hypothetical protein